MIHSYLITLYFWLPVQRELPCLFLWQSMGFPITVIFRFYLEIENIQTENYRMDFRNLYLIEQRSYHL